MKRNSRCYYPVCIFFIICSLEGIAKINEGTAVPRTIPVNVYLPTPSSPTSDTDIFSSPSSSLQTNTLPPTRTSVILTVPERSPISGLAQIVIAYDETRARGVKVEVKGVLGMSIDAESESMAEMCRRGGVFSLAGKVWSAA
jgi:hypothetical protein